MTQASSASNIDVGGASTPEKSERFIDEGYANEHIFEADRVISKDKDKDKDSHDSRSAYGEEKGRERRRLFGKGNAKKPGEGKEKPPMVSIFKLFRFADTKDKIMMAIGLVMACASGVGMPLMTLIFSQLTGRFLTFNFSDTNSESQRDYLDSETRRYCWYFFGLGMGIWVVASLQKLLWGISSERIGRRLREKFYESILRQDIGWFDGLSTGELTARISQDVNLVQEGIGEKFSFVLQYVTTFLAGLILAFTRGWRMTLVVLAVLPLLAGSAALMGVLLAKDTAGGQDAYSEAGGVASEVLSSIKTIMAFGGQQREEERFKSKVVKARSAGLRKAWVLGGCMGFIMFSIYGVYALGFWYGGKLTREKIMEPEDVLNAFFALIVGGFALGNAAPSISAVASARGAAVKVYQVIDRQSPIDAVDMQSGISAENIRGEIELRGVKFRYPTRPEVTVLQDFSIRVKAGEQVALVGESGCGKSTVVSLIERFYDPEQGQVLIDGVDAREYNVRSLRQQIGVIMQTPILFGHSVYQNIIWGAVDMDHPPTREQVEQACRDANAHDFIMALPDGYDTLCGERGALLSGGQKQRIAIARALVRNPRILLLDEATSALDTAAERVVQEALDRASANRTTITIAHRLSTIKNADVIYVMSRGHMLESGSHAELINQGGAYAHLVEAQHLRQKLEQDQRKLDVADSGSSEQASGVHNDDDLVSECSNGNDAGGDAIESKHKNHGIGALFRLLEMNRQHALAMIPGTFLSIIDGASLPCFSLVFARMLVAIGNTDLVEQKRKVDLYGGLFTLFAGVTFIVTFGRCMFFGRAGEKITCNVRQAAFGAMMRQDAAYFDKRENGTGTLTARLATEAGDVNKTVGEAMPAFVVGISSIVAGVTIAFTYGWRLTLVILATLPCLTAAFYFEGKSLYASTQAMKSAYESASQDAAETVNNIRTVVTLTREHTFIKQFCASSDEPYRRALRNNAIGSVGYGFAQSTMFLVYCLAFFVGSRFVLDGYLTVQEMFNVMYAVVFSAIALGMMAQQTSVLTRGLLASEKLLSTLNSVPTIDAQSPDGVAKGSDIGAATLTGVRFAYPTRARAAVLRDVDIDVRPGQTVALVGPSGSGKSTVAALLQRLYDVDDGSIAVNGVEARSWNVAALRAGLAIVGQEPVLLDYTIGENIGYGREGATQHDIEQAARTANAHDFVSNLPDGYATRIGESGTQLSGGQRQRIAIARALVRDPRLLLLDEATSALDAQSESVVQHALDAAAAGRTTITIAHRLSTIQNADLIVVLRAGKVVEQGTHAQLLASGGLYSLLAAQQSLDVAH
ncbi:hypothetical protein IWW36_002683 [Coemansia brasiliensis]|uniref:Uncharacterized protein n=1 Tax=Coemansia brasiliensis TaxID=2650707 RepID=A0A9W8I6U0_9FUNG|nr:hypothetical protein IWW36_002683 [Coemansia brasiliensis]